MGLFFWEGGLSYLCPKNILTMPDSPHPIIIVKIRDFGQFVSLDRMNSVFCLISTTIFFIFGCWLLPKNNGFARLRGLQPAAHPASIPMVKTWCLLECWGQSTNFVGVSCPCGYVPERETGRDVHVLLACCHWFSVNDCCSVIVFVT